uniref:Galectin n=1 Tax=Astyanax mexicanus TaxID=7994 RepID=A0A8B9HV06_ASTMX
MVFGCNEVIKEICCIVSHFLHCVLFASLLQKIPYVGPISGGIKPGMAVYLQGVVPQTANQYTGQSAGDDIAFHFKPQIGQKVSLNSFKKGAWENEESVSDKPFAKGGAFTIIFVIKADVYEVYVNSFQHCTFKHRMSVERVSAIDIRGDVNINMFGFIQASVFSSLDKFSVVMPYTSPLSGGISPGMALCFQGTVASNAKDFTINLQSGPSNSDDRAFHFNPRMGQRVAMNSFRKGKWESEESASVGPFTKGAVFTVFFVVTTQGYEVQCLKHRYFNIALRLCPHEYGYF